MEQWSIGNEAYFVALDDPAEALDRSYGTPTALAMDLEWYAVGAPTAIGHGYEQAGVVHGEIERLHQPNLQLVEAPAHRWRRWGEALAPLPLPAIDATPSWDLRAPFAFPDGTVADWALTPDGWRTR